MSPPSMPTARRWPSARCRPNTRAARRAGAKLPGSRCRRRTPWQPRRTCTCTSPAPTAGELSLDATLSHGIASRCRTSSSTCARRSARSKRSRSSCRLRCARLQPAGQRGGQRRPAALAHGRGPRRRWRSCARAARRWCAGRSSSRRCRRKYLRLHLLGATGGIPLRSIRLLLQPQALATAKASSAARSLADFVRREGRAFVYRLPARVPVERVNVALEDDNAVANFSVSAREAGEQQLALRRPAGRVPPARRRRRARQRGDGHRLDARAGVAHRAEHRPRATRRALELSYRPERWLLLTHGKAPFVVAAGSGTRSGGDFPLERAGRHRCAPSYGRDWQPTPAALGAMQTGRRRRGADRLRSGDASAPGCCGRCCVLGGGGDHCDGAGLLKVRRRSRERSQQQLRIDAHAEPVHAPVHVRPGRATGGADQAEHAGLVRRDRRRARRCGSGAGNSNSGRAHGRAARCRRSGRGPVGEGDDARGRRQHRRAFRRGDVQAGVR